MNRFKGLVLAFVAAAAVAPSSARAQVIFSTFAPGDGYSTGDWWGVNQSQSIAASFGYSGDNGMFLSQIGLALWNGLGGSIPYTISFRHGASISSATTLESWLENVPASDIYTMSSVNTPELVVGDIYWVVAENSSPALGAWFWNSWDFSGFSYSDSPGWTWYADGRVSPAYDVTVAPGSVTPEPATLLLLGRGLLGIGGVVRRRRKSVES